MADCTGAGGNVYQLANFKGQNTDYFMAQASDGYNYYFQLVGTGERGRAKRKWKGEGEREREKSLRMHPGWREGLTFFLYCLGTLNAGLDDSIGASCNLVTNVAGAQVPSDDSACYDLGHLDQQQASYSASGKQQGEGS